MCGELLHDLSLKTKTERVKRFCLNQSYDMNNSEALQMIGHGHHPLHQHHHHHQDLSSSHQHHLDHYHAPQQQQQQVHSSTQNNGCSDESGSSPPPPPHATSTGNASSSGNPELSFEDFTPMSPFLDPASLHLAAAASTSPYTLPSHHGKTICCAAVISRKKGAFFWSKLFLSVCSTHIRKQIIRD